MRGGGAEGHTIQTQSPDRGFQKFHRLVPHNLINATPAAKGSSLLLGLRRRGEEGICPG